MAKFGIPSQSTVPDFLPLGFSSPENLDNPPITWEEALEGPAALFNRYLEEAIR